MIATLVRVVRSLVRMFQQKDAPPRIAMGVTLGMLVGLVPKENLIATALGVVLLASRANLIAGAAAALVFSWAGMVLDPLAHALGSLVLGAGFLQGLWVWLYQLPLVPWTHFNNTVVLGELILGLALAWPVYRGTHRGIERYRDRVTEKIEEQQAGKALAYAETATRWRIP